MTFRYSPQVDPESWVALVEGQRALLLGGPIDEALIDGAWTRLHDGAPALLELLTSRGLQATPPFALVEPAEGGVRVIVRGDATATVGGESVTGAGAATWIERVLPTAPIVIRALGPEPTGVALPVTHGVVRTARLESVGSLTSMPRSTPSAPVVTPVPATEAAPAPAPASAPEPASVPAAAPIAVPASVPASAHVAAPAESTIMHDDLSPVGAANGVSEEPPEGPSSDVDASTDADGYDYLFGATMYRSVSEAAVESEVADDAEAPAVASEVESNTAGDHDGATMLVSKLGRVRGRGKAKAAAATAPAAPAAASLVLTLPSGARESLDEPLVLGRAPSVSGVPAGALPRLVPLPDGDQDLSRNHVRVELQGGTVVVTDLHSKNGTTVALPGAKPVRLRGGEPTPVITGTVVELGGVLSLTVEEL